MKAIVSGDLPENIRKSLGSYADVFSLCPDDALAAPVRSHPDMILAIIEKNAFVPRLYAEKNPRLCSFLSETGLKPVRCVGERGADYPHDVGLNLAVGDGFIVCRVRSTDETVLDAARENGYDIIEVKQGYAGCSSIVCGGSVITSDKGIFDAVKASGRETILVPNDGIRLPGYDVGFIGGCGGYADGVLYFFGNIDALPCGTPIRAFAERKGYSVVCLSDGALTDYGGIKFI